MHRICLYHTWNTPMEYACIMHGLRLYHAWNTLVPRMEHTCTMHGICLYHACFLHEMHHAHSMHGTCAFHAWNMHEMQALIHAWHLPLKRPKSFHVTFRNHAWFMYGLANCSIYIVAGNFMHENYWQEMHWNMHVSSTLECGDGDFHTIDHVWCLVKGHHFYMCAWACTLQCMASL